MFGILRYFDLKIDAMNDFHSSAINAPFYVTLRNLIGLPSKPCWRHMIRIRKCNTANLQDSFSEIQMNAICQTSKLENRGERYIRLLTTICCAFLQFFSTRVSGKKKYISTQPILYSNEEDAISWTQKSTIAQIKTNANLISTCQKNFISQFHYR